MKWSWLLIVLGIGIGAWVLLKGKSTGQKVPDTTQKVTSSPGVPTLPTPTNTVIVTDQITSTEALGKAVADAVEVGQEKVVYNSPNPITVDVPSVVAAANLNNQSVTDWLTTQFPSQPYAQLPTDAAARTAVIADYTAVKAKALAKLSSGGGWASLTPAEHAAASGVPIETWQLQYGG